MQRTPNKLRVLCLSKRNHVVAAHGHEIRDSLGLGWPGGHANDSFITPALPAQRSLQPVSEGTKGRGANDFAVGSDEEPKAAPTHTHHTLILPLTPLIRHAVSHQAQTTKPCLTLTVINPDPPLCACLTRCTPYSHPVRVCPPGHPFLFRDRLFIVTPWSGSSSRGHRGCYCNDRSLSPDHVWNVTMTEDDLSQGQVAHESGSLIVCEAALQSSKYLHPPRGCSVPPHWYLQIFTLACVLPTNRNMTKPLDSIWLSSAVCSLI
jgi:hypothetical protein